MEHQPFRGVWATMPTPWNADFAVDADAVHELVARYAAAGLHGAYTTGIDGEMHVLDLEDFRTLAEAFGRSTASAGLPAQMGCTWSHTDGVIERARIASGNGISTIQIALPSWVPLSDLEVRRFFAALQDAVPDMRFVHYNIARSGRFLTGEDYRGILDVAPSLVGSKHTGGDVGSLIEIIQATPDLAHFVVDSQIVPGALFGARGFYSFIANLSPQFALHLWRCCEDGRWEEAARLRETSDALFRAWLSDTQGVSASPALAKIATRAGVFPDLALTVRAPYVAGEDRHVAELKQLVAERFPALATPSISTEDI